MEKIIASLEALAQMRQRSGTWAAYQNHVLDSADLGHLKFLKVVPGCIYGKPPCRYPDTFTAMDWRYIYIGMVNMETGAVES